MSRRIVWTEYQSSESEVKIDGYFDRLRDVQLRSETRR